MGKVLRSELANDPEGRGYSSMTAVEAANDLNTEYRTRQIPTLSGNQIFKATDKTEFADLSDHKQTLWLSFCSTTKVDAWAQTNVDFVEFIFGSSSQTAQNLGDLRTEPQSRAEELGLGTVTEGDIKRARSG